MLFIIQNASEVHPIFLRMSFSPFCTQWHITAVYFQFYIWVGLFLGREKGMVTEISENLLLLGVYYYYFVMLSYCTGCEDIWMCCNAWWPTGVPMLSWVLKLAVAGWASFSNTIPRRYLGFPRHSPWTFPLDNPRTLRSRTFPRGQFAGHFPPHCWSVTHCTN